MLRKLLDWRRILVCLGASLSLLALGLLSDPRAAIIFFLGLATGILLSVIEYHTRPE